MSDCKTLPASQRNSLIAFLAETETKDANGDVSVSLVEVKKAWAKVQPVRATEKEQHGAYRDMRVVLFTFPRVADLKAEWRIKWNGREHNIKEVLDSGVPGEDMRVTAISGVAQ